MDHSSLRLGIDLGGTKIEAVLLDGAGSVVWKKRNPSPRNDYSATLSALEALVIEARRAVNAAAKCSIGIGIPGSLSPADGRVRNANSIWLNGQPLQDDLQTLLGQTVRIANDANCLAVSEAADGAAKGFRSVFAVILGTGVGGAHLIDGQLVVGANGLAGEWGHVPMPWMRPDEFDQTRCWCSRPGCIETFLSGPALVREFNARSAQSAGSVQDILRLANTGHADAEIIIERFHDRLARALAMVINIIDPEVIVLGGGLSNIESIYSEIPQRWARWTFSDIPPITRLRPAMHGDASGVRGAAWL